MSNALRAPRAPGSICVVVISEIRFYREGLALSIGNRAGLEVVGMSEDLATTLDLARRLRIDVGLLDTATANSHDIIRSLKGAGVGVVVALGVREHEREVIPLAEAGASAFVSRDASLDDVHAAVESAASGETRCSGRIAGMLTRRVAILAAQVLPQRADIPLTSRQLEIIRLIDEGLPNKEIARRLFIAVPTVKNHIHNILGRLGVHHRAEAVSVVRRLSGGLLPD